MKNRKLITLGLLGTLLLGGYSLPVLANGGHGYPSHHIKYKTYHAPHAYGHSSYGHHYQHGYYPRHYRSHYYRPYRSYGHGSFQRGHHGHHTSSFAIKLHF